MTHLTFRQVADLVESYAAVAARFLVRGLIAAGSSTTALPTPCAATHPARPGCPRSYVRRGQREIERFLATAADEFRPHGP